MLGQAAALGVAPSLLLRADPVERELLLEAIPEAHAYLEQRDRRLAQMVVEELSKAMRR